jgi:hypothetical protein
VVLTVSGRSRTALRFTIIGILVNSSSGRLSRPSHAGQPGEPATGPLRRRVIPAHGSRDGSKRPTIATERKINASPCNPVRAVPYVRWRASREPCATCHRQHGRCGLVRFRDPAFWSMHGLAVRMCRSVAGVGDRWSDAVAGSTTARFASRQHIATHRKIMARLYADGGAKKL